MLPNKFTIEFNKVASPAFYITELAEALALVDKLCAGTGLLAADLETTPLPEYSYVETAALSPHTSDIRLVQIATDKGVAVFDLHEIGKEIKPALKKLFETRGAIFHNLNFDYQFLRHRLGVTTSNFHCTCIMARLLLHATYFETMSAALGPIVEHVFGQELVKEAGASNWANELTFEQVSYAAVDAIAVRELYNKLTIYLHKLGLNEVYDLYRAAQIGIAEMAINGIGLNSNYHMENVVKWRDELVIAKAELLKVTGLDRITSGSIAGWLQENLPEDMLSSWPRTEPEEGKTPKLKTDAHTFSDYGTLDICKPFAKYQKLYKLTTSFGGSLLYARNQATLRLHPGYSVAGARTGRLSCSNPNLQQSPRDPAFRKAFIPTKGYEFVIADYSQIEVRAIAEISNDPIMLKAYEDGLDIYAYTAAHLNSKDIKDVTKPERQHSKCLVLGLNYGLGAKKFSHYAKKSYGVIMTDEDAIGSVKAYFKLYSRLKQWQRETTTRCVEAGYMTYTKLGKSRKLTEDTYYGASLNHPVQGSTAEVMLRAIVYVREACAGTSMRLIATVHDELIVECLPEDTAKVKELMTGAMIKAYLKTFPSGRTVKKLVEPTSGSNWAEAKG